MEGMMYELKPCPFCGGEAKINSKTVEGTAFMWVSCMKCDATSRIFEVRGANRRISKGEPIFQKIVAPWNRRAEAEVE